MNRSHSRTFTLIALAFLALALAACAAKETPAEPEVQEAAVGDVADGLQAAPEANLAPPAGEPAFEGGEAAAGLAPGAVEAEERAAAPATGADEALAPAAMPPMPTQVVEMPDTQFQADLTAGEINDNEQFEEYLQYRTDYGRFVGMNTVHDRDVSERYIITVRTRGGLPVLGAEVLIYGGQNLVATLRTPATGTVYFFPRAFPAADGVNRFNVSVSKGGAVAEFDLPRGGQSQAFDVTLNVPASQPPVKLDVLFLIDTTGSMADEINQLKNNILSISAQIEALPSRPDVRFGMVTYRDIGDIYVTQTFDFVPDVQRFQRDLQNVQAAGGGDTPESFNEALHRAVWDVSWRVEDTVSLVFLVADAPPHLDYAQDFDYAQEMVNAAGLGIKVFPISSELGESFYQSQAEYIFRQIALFTGGHFIFLTYESQPQSSGEPGRDDLSVQEGSYTVEDLDALVVRLIREELAALGGQ
ncbi:MAG: hypothetical protein Kow00124_24830 [Anaerolineae bacterium]